MKLPVRHEVLGQQRITLGSANYRTDAALIGLRRITARVGPLPVARRFGTKAVYDDLINDRWELQPEKVVWAYLRRWQIKLLFRCGKSHLHLARWLGYRENAVHLTIYLAIIAHLLCVPAAEGMGYAKRHPVVLRHLGELLSPCEPQAPMDGLAVPRPSPGWDLATLPTGRRDPRTAWAG